LECYVRPEGFDRGVYSIPLDQIEDPVYDVLFREVHDLVRAVGTGELLPVRD